MFPKYPQHISVRYGCAILAVIAATGVRWLLQNDLSSAPQFVTFYSAVAMVALLAGGGPALLTTLLSAAVVCLWLHFGNNTVGEFVGLLLFVVSGLIVSGMSELLRRARHHETETFEQLLAKRTKELEQTNTNLRHEIDRRQQVERKLRLFIEHAPAAIAMFDREMRYLGASRRWREDYQLADDVVSRSHYELIPEIPDDWKEVHRRGLAGEEISSSGERFVRGDGSVQWIKWEVLPWYTDTNDVAGILIAAEDISRQIQSDEAMRQLNESLEQQVVERTQKLRNREDRLQATLNATLDAVVTIDQRGRIQTVNPAAEAIFGYSAAELVGQNVSMLMPEPYHGEHDGYLNHYLNTGVKRILGSGRELVGKKKDGFIFPIELKVNEIPSLHQFIGIIRDISERKELQRHVLEIAAQEQRRIGQDLHDGTGQELTGLALFAGTLREILQTDCAEDGTGRFRTLGEREWKQAQQVSQRLLEGLEVAKRHVHELSHGILPVQIDAEGLRTALEQLADATNATGSVRCRFETRGAIAVLDNTAATHMFRIVQEALNNAVRHGQADEIQISITQNERQISIAIDDNGVGFNPDEPRHGRPSEGMGLRTMEYRAGMIGGVLNIERRAQGGMRVKCTVHGRKPNAPSPITAPNDRGA